MPSRLVIAVFANLVPGDLALGYDEVVSPQKGLATTHGGGDAVSGESRASCAYHHLHMYNICIHIIFFANMQELVYLSLIVGREYKNP